MDGEYTEAVEKLAPMMPELQKKIQVYFLPQNGGKNVGVFFNDYHKNKEYNKFQNHLNIRIVLCQWNKSVFSTFQGSKAQKDIFRQILLHAAAKSNTKQNLDLAMDILNNRLVEAKVKEHTPLNQR